MLTVDNDFKITKIVEVNTPGDNKGILSIAGAPGRKEERHIRNITEDINVILEQKYEMVLCLLTWEEMDKLYMSEYPRYIQNRGITFLHLPIIDGYVPKIAETRPVINEIIEFITKGKNVLIHCKCGYGRAGTIVACILLHFKFDVNKAIKLVRIKRKGAIQTKAQENFIISYDISLRR